MIDQKEPRLNFSNQNNEDKENLNKNILYYKKIIKPSDDELKNHTDYIKTQLKKNFY